MFAKLLTKFIPLIAILCLSAFLNFYRLGELPNGLYIDEASNGYNAYSLLMSGKDEYGQAWPVAMRFLGSYSPPLYSYLTMLSVKFWGLSVWSVRLVSAVSGVLGVLLVWWFLNKMCSGFGTDSPRRCDSIDDEEKYHTSEVLNGWLPYLGALVMAISPWNVLYARAGYEIYLGALLFWIGAVLLWLGVMNGPRTSRYMASLGLVMLSLSTYGAHTERYLVPVFILFFIVLFKADVKRFQVDLSRCREDIKSFRWRAVHLGGVIQLISKKSITPPRWYLLGGIFLTLLIQIPNFYLVFTPAWWNKSSLFYSQTGMEMAQKYYAWALGWASWVMGFGRKFGAQYLTYFSPRSLFYLSDPDPQRSMPELSVFYSWMVVPYAVGLYWLWRKRKTDGGKFLWLLLLVIPLPAALTNDPFSTQRAMPLLMPMAVVIALGLSFLLSKYRTKLFRGIIVSLFLFSLISLYRSYFVFLPVERARAWNYGYEGLANEIQKRPDEHFVIDQSRQKPVYIELAFWMRLSPGELQAVAGQSIRDDYYSDIQFDSEYTFANIQIRGIDWERDIYENQILVGDSLAISDDQAREHQLTEVFEIKDPRGGVLFRGWRTDPMKKCEVSVEKSDLCGRIVQ